MKKFSFLLLALAIAFMPAAAQAGPVGTVDISGFTGVTVTLTNIYHSGSTTAGSVVISDAQGLPPLLSGSSYIGFCVDLQHTISPPVGDQAAELLLMSAWNGYGVFTPQTFAGNYAAYLYNTFAGAVSTNDERGGLALAIWNVLYDSDFTVNAGSFSATNGGAITAANGFLSNLQGNTQVAMYSDAYWIRTFTPNTLVADERPQDFIVGVPDGGATLMLLGGALMGLGALRRKFRQ